MLLEWRKGAAHNCYNACKERDCVSRSFEGGNQFLESYKNYCAEMHKPVHIERISKQKAEELRFVVDL